MGRSPLRVASHDLLTDDFETEHGNVQERLRKEKKTLQNQRKQLEWMDLSAEDTQPALGPLISFRNQLREEIKTTTGSDEQTFRICVISAASADDAQHAGRRRTHPLVITTGILMRRLAP